MDIFLFEYHPILRFILSVLNFAQHCLFISCDFGQPQETVMSLALFFGFFIYLGIYLFA